MIKYMTGTTLEYQVKWYERLALTIYYFHSDHYHRNKEQATWRAILLYHNSLII